MSHRIEIKIDDYGRYDATVAIEGLDLDALIARLTAGVPGFWSYDYDVGFWAGSFDAHNVGVCINEGVLHINGEVSVDDPFEALDHTFIDRRLKALDDPDRCTPVPELELGLDDHLAIVAVVKQLIH